MRRLRTTSLSYAMRRGLLLSLTLVICASSAAADTARILLVGDSWVAQAWSARSFDAALENMGLGQFTEVGGATTIGGSTAAQWTTAPRLQLITDALALHPTVDIVHLSMGGNDFLGAPPGTDLVTLAQQILADQQTVADHIFALRPNARITINTYDYTLNGLNTEQQLLAALSIQQTNATPGFFTLNQLGLLHHVFGIPGLTPPGTLPLPGNHPDYTPIGGGDPAQPGHSSYFRDGIHPTDAGYLALAEHAVATYYAGWLLVAPPVPLLNPGSVLALVSTLGAAGVFAVRLRQRG